MLFGIVLWFIFILSRTWINRDMYQILATTKCAPSVFHIQEFQNMLFSRDQRKYWVNVSFASTKTNMWNVRTKAIVFASCFLLFLCVSRKIQLKGRANRILELLQKVLKKERIKVQFKGRAESCKRIFCLLPRNLLVASYSSSRKCLRGSE